MTYLPFGEDLNQVFQDETKFGTYWEDSSTGFSYADQRYYSSIYRRFMTADQFKQTPKANHSGSWNKHSYSQNDPINKFDPHGALECGPDDDPEDCDPNPRDDYYCYEDPGPEPAPPAKPKQPKILYVTNIAKSGANYNTVTKRLNQISAGIDPQCESFLQSGGESVSSYISAIESANLLAVANFTATIAAITNTGGTDVPDGTAAIIVNNNGAFFNSQYDVDNGMYTGGTGQAQIAILLHELAHALGATGFQRYYGNSKAGQANDSLINQNCNKTIRNLGSQ